MKFSAVYFWIGFFFLNCLAINAEPSKETIENSATESTESSSTEAGVLEGLWQKVSNLFSRDAERDGSDEYHNQRAGRAGNFERYFSGRKLSRDKSFQKPLKEISETQDQISEARMPVPAQFSIKDVKKDADTVPDVTEEDEEVIDTLSNSFVNAVGKVADALSSESTTIWEDRRRVANNFDNPSVYEENKQKSNFRDFMEPPRNFPASRQSSQLQKLSIPVDDALRKELQINGLKRQPHGIKPNVMPRLSAQALKLDDTIIHKPFRNIPEKLDISSADFNANKRYDMLPLPANRDSYGMLNYLNKRDSFYNNPKDDQVEENSGVQQNDAPDDMSSAEDVDSETGINKMHAVPKAIIANQDLPTKIPVNESEDDDKLIDEDQKIKQEITKKVKVGPQGTHIHEEKVRKIMKETSFSEVEDENLQPGVIPNKENIPSPIEHEMKETGNDESLATTKMNIPPQIQDVESLEPIITARSSPPDSSSFAEERSTGGVNIPELSPKSDVVNDVNLITTEGNLSGAVIGSQAESGKIVETHPGEPINKLHSELTNSSHPNAQGGLVGQDSKNEMSGFENSEASVVGHMGSNAGGLKGSEAIENISMSSVNSGLAKGEVNSGLPSVNAGENIIQDNTSTEKNSVNPVAENRNEIGTDASVITAGVEAVGMQSESTAAALRKLKELLSRVGVKNKFDLLTPMKFDFKSGSVEMKIINSDLHLNFIIPFTSSVKSRHTNKNNARENYK